MPASVPTVATFNRPINLPWNQAEHYWICVAPRIAAPPAMAATLTAVGMEARDSYFTLATSRDWAIPWQRVHAALASAGMLESVTAAVIGGEAMPEPDQISQFSMPPLRIDAIAAQLWLGEALLSGSLMCFLQPVMNARGQAVGYEAFARVRREDGEIIGGHAIVNAGRILSIEYALDRQLQIEAIKSFAHSGVEGVLFVNFLPGFIQRPEVYLEGMAQMAQAHGIAPKHLVLDFTRSGSSDDIAHLKRVCDYCHSKGYAVALDDIDTLYAVQTLLPEIRPDYVKLDIQLVLRAAKLLPPSTDYEIIRDIVEYCRKHNTVVLAEGVETQESFDALKNLQVELFQGYYFSPPVPVEEIKNRRS